MVSILNKIKESFNVQKKDGSLKGPYEASFTRDAIIVTDLLKMMNITMLQR